MVKLGRAFKSFDTRLVNKILDEMTPGNRDLEKLSDDQLEVFIGKYQVASKS